MRARILFASILVLLIAAGAVAVIVNDEVQPVPVVVVPGFGGTAGMVSDITARLRADGFIVEPITLPLLGTGRVEDSAEALARYIDDLDAEQVDIVGFSAGGLAVRYYLRFLEGTEEARRVVLLGVPNHGAAIAQVVESVGDRLCGGACDQLRPGSELLAELNEGDESPGEVFYASIYSEVDPIVRPVTTALLEGALNIRLQDVCSDNASDHGGLLDEPLPVGLVVALLRGDMTEAPGPSSCASLRTLGSPGPPISDSSS